MEVVLVVVLLVTIVVEDGFDAVGSGTAVEIFNASEVIVELLMFTLGMDWMIIKSSNTM